MQRIVHLFRLEVLGEVLRTPNPVILPLILYENSFDVGYFHFVMSAREICRTF